MPLRTVSNTGGNWNATTAWVGGVVPIAGDTVDFTATSGNLTVNVLTAILAGIDFTNYVNTITFNNEIRTNTTINLGTGGYTQAGTSGLQITGGNTTISGTTVWNSQFTFSGTAYTVTLSNDLNITGLTIFSNSGSITFSTGGNLFNPTGDMSITNGARTLPNDIYIRNLTLNGNSTPTITANKIYVLGNLTVDGTNSIIGTTEIILSGTGTWSNTSNAELRNNLTIDTNDIITLDTNVYYGGGTLKYIKGKVITKNSTLTLGTSTLINCHKINFDRIIIRSGTTLTMNEFFCGSPNLKTTISNIGVSNYNITFQDGFEKITKFVNITRATITKRNQLLVITDSKKSSTNSGIRYINSSPNGIAKGDPSIQNILTPGLNTFLISDPNMNIK